MGPEAGRWLAYRHEVPGGPASPLLLGRWGASMFGLWDLGTPAGVEVCPLQLPGRENRLGELPMIRISRQSRKAIPPITEGSPCHAAQ